MSSASPRTRSACCRPSWAARFGSGLAAAISVVPGNDGGDRPEALGQGCAHTAADDPRFRPPPGDDPDLSLGADEERAPHGAEAQRRRQHVALRGLPGERRQLGRRRFITATMSRSVHRLVQLDLASPMDMRAPGAAAGRLRARMRDGRAELCAWHRSARASPEELFRDRWRMRTSPSPARR